MFYLTKETYKLLFHKLDDHPNKTFAADREVYVKCEANVW